MRAALERLRARLRADRQAFRDRVSELRGLTIGAADPAVAAQVAVALHHAYGAVEAALARTARTLEGEVPEGPDWHQALLESMGLEIEGIRPAVLSGDSLQPLRRLLAFRHFFRHAYAVAWDAERLAELRAVVLRLEKPLLRDLDALDQLLRSLAAAED